MARIATDNIVIAGCPTHIGDRILLNFPAANRDPEAFTEPDSVILDREQTTAVQRRPDGRS